MNNLEPKDGKHQDGEKEVDTQASGGNDNAEQETKAEENVGAGDLVD